MIIKIHASGKSFKGLVRYLGHDPKAETKERVAWTHTLNTASDHPSAALHEIYWTYKAADELKREAGVRKGGRRLETPVKHFSLSWEPGDAPSQQHMVATVEGFLKHMGWGDHQAVLFAHNDTAHRHVHVVLNAVHPETGRKLDERNDWRRAEPWGLAYELGRGEVLCQQRLLHPSERTPTPTRTTWQQLRSYEREDEAHEASRVSGNWEYFDRKSPEERRDREWQALKEHQRKEREEFFAHGKEAYQEVRQAAYREIRSTFRSEWKEYFSAERDGFDKDGLAAMKADLVARQKAALDAERGVATKALRVERDKHCAHLLAQQKVQRQELRQAQQQGRAYTILDVLHPAPDQREKRGQAPERAARSRSPTQKSWDALRDYEPNTGAKPRERQSDYLDRPRARDRAKREREVLNGQQETERNAFYGTGKEGYRSARRDARQGVAEEMRSTWTAIRQAKSSGHDRTQLAGLRFIRLRQFKETGQFRVRVATVRLRSQRDKEIKGLNQHHKAERNALRHRRLRNLRSYRVMDADRGLVKANDAVRATQSAEEARHQQWRQSKPLVPERVVQESEAARFAAALRHTTERSMRVAEFEDRLRHAWRRIRPGPSRGRD